MFISILKVSRMLPGGLLVLGVFIIATPELSKDSQNALRRVSVLPGGQTRNISSCVAEEFSVIVFSMYGCFLALFLKAQI